MSCAGPETHSLGIRMARESDQKWFSVNPEILSANQNSCVEVPLEMEQKCSYLR